MSSMRYLNTILTVIAVLLTADLWTRWTALGDAAGGSGRLGPIAKAAEPSQGIPDAAAQRRQMVDLLKRISQQTDVLTGMFRSGDAKVRLETPPAERR